MILLAPHEEALIGRLPDCALAREIGVSPHIIRRRRLARGLPVVSHRPWTDTELVQVQEFVRADVRHSEIACLLGRTRHAVQDICIKHSIRSPYANRTAWPVELDELLGSVPDTVLVARFGCSRSTVRARRKALDMPPWAKPRAKLPSHVLLGALYNDLRREGRSTRSIAEERKVSVRSVAKELKRYRLAVEREGT